MIENYNSRAYRRYAKRRNLKYDIIFSLIMILATVGAVWIIYTVGKAAAVAWGYV